MAKGCNGIKDGDSAIPSSGKGRKGLITMHTAKKPLPATSQVAAPLPEEEILLQLRENILIIYLSLTNISQP